MVYVYQEVHYSESKVHWNIDRFNCICISKKCWLSYRAYELCVYTPNMKVNQVTFMHVVHDILQLMNFSN